MFTAQSNFNQSNFYFCVTCIHNQPEKAYETCGAAVPGAEQIQRQEEMNGEHYEAADAAEWEIPVQETWYQRTRSMQDGRVNVTDQQD